MIRTTYNAIYRLLPVVLSILKDLGFKIRLLFCFLALRVTVDVCCRLPLEYAEN